ncbi:hypothetical protein ACIBCO_35960 [Streptomyces violascens]|uniref:hypothetical protein n=1 Tax=Streptomyces violascens TaxID=67381 RepID=UPI0037AF29E9
MTVLTLRAPAAAPAPRLGSYNLGESDGELAALTGLPSARVRARACMAEQYDPMYAQGYIDGYLAGTGRNAVVRDGGARSLQPHNEMRDFIRDALVIGSTLNTRDADECLRDHETALLAGFVDRCATALCGCCGECDSAIQIMRGRLVETLDGQVVTERMNLRWAEQVDHSHDPAKDTVVHCTDADGRPYALLLGDELCEALGGMLSGPPDPDEVAAENGEPGGGVSPVPGRFIPDPEHPGRYLKSPTGMLHLRAESISGGPCDTISRCGLDLDVDRASIPETVATTDRLCKRCPVIEP